MRTTRLSLPLIALVGAALFACGGSDGDAGSDAAATPATAVDESSPTDDATTAATTAASTAASTAVASYAGGKGGVVTIGGVAYTFSAEICLFQAPDLIASGPGQSDDGTTAWVDVNVSDGGAGFVTVGVGQTEAFSMAPDDQPGFAAESYLGDEQYLTYTFGNDGVTGSGEVIDRNYVALQASETAPMTFEASCG